VALCHFNLNLDNAWFWTDEMTTCRWHSRLGRRRTDEPRSGHHRHGLLRRDWLPQRSRDDLITLFVEQFERVSGHALDAGTLAYLIKLSMMLSGIAWMLTSRR